MLIVNCGFKKKSYLNFRGQHAVSCNIHEITNGSESTPHLLQVRREPLPLDSLVTV